MLIQLSESDRIFMELTRRLPLPEFYRAVIGYVSSGAVYSVGKGENQPQRRRGAEKGARC